jgi:hypothetical protein
MQRFGGVDWNAMAMGLPIGIAIGVGMDNVLFGVPIGIMFGIAFAAGRRNPGDGDGGRRRTG